MMVMNPSAYTSAVNTILLLFTRLSPFCDCRVAAQRPLSLEALQITPPRSGEDRVSRASQLTPLDVGNPVGAQSGVTQCQADDVAAARISDFATRANFGADVPRRQNPKPHQVREPERIV